MIQQELINDFAPLIQKLARTNFINVTVGCDDLNQDLWTKVYEVLPRLKQCMERDAQQGYQWGREDIFRWMKVVLGNHIKDIKHGESKIPGSSQFSLSGLDFSEMIGSEVSFINEEMSDFGQEEIVAAKELLDLIVNWANTQSESIKRLILERIETSPEVEAAWEERLKSSPRCKNAKNIPIWSMLKILGLKQGDFYKMREDLSKYLNQNGYSVEFN